MRLLVDNNLPPRVARALNELVKADDHSVVALRDKFAENTPDVEWIEALGAEGGWVVLTLDHDIVRRKAEKAAWRKARLIAFVLTRGWSTFPPLDTAWRLIRWWPQIVQQASLAAPGSTFELGPKLSGRIRTL